MNIKKTLQAINHYYAITRRVGHTITMLRGAQNVDNCIVICSGHDTNLPKNINTIQLSTVKDRICGMNKPMLIDNCAMRLIAKSAYEEIERLEKIIDDNKKELNQTANPSLIMQCNYNIEYLNGLLSVRDVEIKTVEGDSHESKTL